MKMPGTSELSPTELPQDDAKVLEDVFMRQRPDMAYNCVLSVHQVVPSPPVRPITFKRSTIEAYQIAHSMAVGPLTSSALDKAVDDLAAGKGRVRSFADADI